MIFTACKKPKVFIVGPDFVTDYMYIKNILDEFFDFRGITKADIYTYDKAIGVCKNVAEYAKYRGWSSRQVKVGYRGSIPLPRNFIDCCLIIPPNESPILANVTSYSEVCYETFITPEGYRFALL